MMDFALVLSALMLGLAGAPHCLAMCAAPCAAAVGRGGRPGQLAFHGARVAAYAAAGAVAASSVGALAAIGESAPVFKPLWTLLHLAALGLGLWLAATGRQPAWLESVGRGAARRAPAESPASAGWQRLHGPVMRSAAAGGLWVAWPCGLLQSALLVAALANTAVAGAAAMAVFGLATAGSLVAGPWLWRQVAAGGGGVLGSAALGVRVAGVVLATASAWALGRHSWEAVAAYCFG